MSKPRAFASVTNAFALFASTARDASVLASSRAWARARSQPPFHALATTPTRAAYATSARAVDAIHRTMDDERRRRLGLPKRTGVVAIKAGMTCEWDARGARVPLTVLWLDDVVVVKTLSSDGDDGYDAVQIGYGSRKPKQVSKGELGHYVRHGSNIKRGLCEFRVSADGRLAPGTTLGAAHFVAGQYVDVTGVTKGKGFQGPMKRWGFSGQPASHGNTKKHRAHGSIGQCQDPGRVFKGKKMAGRMGGRNRTVQSVYVYKVDTVRNLVYVKGQVPGNAGTAVKIRDSLRKPPILGEQVPFPTATPGEHPEGVFTAAPHGMDPYGGSGEANA